MNIEKEMFLISRECAPPSPAAGVFGLGLLLLSGTLLGFSLTLLILLSSCAWRNFRSSSRFGSAEFDADCEHDPFLPAHSAAGGASFGGPGGHHYMSRRYGSQNNSPDLRYERVSSSLSAILHRGL